jgi:cobalt-zinc-cadmium efflux system outer membrane protein
MRRTVAAATEASAAAARELRRAGNITELQLAAEESLAGQARLDLASAESEVVQDRERLNVLMGLWGPDTQWRLAGRLPELPADEVAAGGLESHAVAERPDLAAAGQAVAAAAQALGLTRATQLFPDATVGAHFEREPGGEKTFGPSIEFPIPLLDQGQAKAARGLALLRQARRRYEAAAVEARSQVRAAYARMLAARQRAEYYRRQVLPLYGRILEQTERQYNAMQVGVFALLQAKQSQIDAGRSYIEALRDYWVARTELEKAVGGRLPGPPHGVSATRPATLPVQALEPIPQPAAPDPGHLHDHAHD